MNENYQSLAPEPYASHVFYYQDSGYQPSTSLSSSMTEGSQSLASEPNKTANTTSPSSNISDPDQSKDFLIDDDYKDQPELTFCCHQEEEGEEGHSIEAGFSFRAD